MLLMTFLAVAGLAACSDDDEPKDSVKEIRMLVSAETGVTYAWGDDMKKNPIECSSRRKVIPKNGKTLDLNR